MERLVSIIIPVYNVQAYLPKCLDSLLAQTYKNIEIILVDDGSKDEGGAICDAYGEKDSRIRVIHKENGGAGPARNTGLEVASGELLMFVDPDDHMSADAVQVLHDRLVADGSDLAVGKFVFEYADGSTADTYCRWMTDRVMTREEAFSETNFPVCAWGKLYRREIFDSLRYPELVCAEDLWVYPSMLERCERISVTSHLIYYYYQRWNGLTYTRSEKALSATLEAKIYMTKYLLDHGYLGRARHFYHTAIGTAAQFPDRHRAMAIIKDAFPPAQRRKLASLTSRVRSIGIRFPKLYRRIYRTAIWARKHLLRR